jgi:hypothetical protein
MDKHYADTVRLLLSIAPDVFDNDIFAMKGGIAINLLLQDIPACRWILVWSALADAARPGYSGSSLSS